MKHLHIMALATTLAAAIQPAPAATRYTITVLPAPDPAATSVVPQAINDSGIVAGYYSQASVFTSSRPCVWRNGIPAKLPLPPGTTQSYAALAIDSAGAIVGYATDDDKIISTACLWLDGEISTFAKPAGVTSNEAYGYGRAGRVVGSYYDSTGIHAVQWYLGTPFPLAVPAGITDSGAYCGNGSGLVIGIYGSPTRPCTWLNGVFAPLPLPEANATTASPRKVNASGLIVGGYSLPNNTSYGCTWAAGQPSKLPPVAGFANSAAFDVNDAGLIVGTSSDAGFHVSRATIWQGGVAARLPEPPGTVQSIAAAINASGQIAGYYTTDGSKYLGFVLTPIPSTAPTVKITGPKKITTHKAKLTIKGRATGEVTSVTAKVGKKTVKARGTASWSLKAALKPGKNQIAVIAHGPGGDSAPAKLTVTRKP